MNQLIHYLNRTLERGTHRSRYNIVSIGIVGLIGHPLYWAIWVYLFPQPYESPFLRFSGAALCLPLALANFWPAKLKRFLPAYWHFAVLYVLPFIFTYLMLQNDYNLVWLLCHLGMIVLVMQLIPEIVWYIIVLVVGSLAGATLFVAEEGIISFGSFNPEYIPILLFMLFIGTLLQYMAHKAIKDHEEKLARERERGKIFKALSGSIAHEVRTPVSAGRQATELLQNTLSGISGSLKDDDPLKSKIDYSTKITEITKNGLNRGDMIIKVILRNIREKEVDPSSLVTLDIKSVTEKALAEYAFQPGERDKISVDLDDSFEFRGEEEVVIFIIFNLLRNALFYAAGSTLPIIITADAARKTLAVKDHGPGIPEDKLEGIFDSFVTSGKNQGTGLGLSFCKRGMKDMGGSIHCNSELGKYTEFVLKFATE